MNHKLRWTDDGKSWILCFSLIFSRCFWQLLFCFCFIQLKMSQMFWSFPNNFFSFLELQFKVNFEKTPQNPNLITCFANDVHASFKFCVAESNRTNIKLIPAFKQVRNSIFCVFCCVDPLNSARSLCWNWKKNKFQLEMYHENPHLNFNARTRLHSWIFASLILSPEELHLLFFALDTSWVEFR